MKRDTKSRGFTLIELLVVIAIIAILAAILFPVFARARENARRTSCMSNLKQMGIGMMQYVQDYDGNYPARYYFSGSATPGGGSGTMVGQIVPPLATGATATADWLLEPYTKSRQLAVCPSWTGSTGGGYGFNLMAGIPSSYTDPKILVLSESTVEVASQMIAFIDSSWYRDAYPVATSTGTFNGNWDANFCRIPNDNCSDNPTTDKRFGRHLEGINASYMDGHAKWNKVDHFYNQGQNYPVWKGWQ